MTPRRPTVRESVAELRQELEARYPILDPAGRRRLDVSLEARFAGQAFEITVELPEASLAGLTTADLLQRFSEAHRRIYRQAADTQTRTVEIVSLRVGPARAAGRCAEPGPARAPPDARTRR